MEQYVHEAFKIHAFISFGRIFTSAWFPHGLEKMENLFPVREKSGNFEKTGKVREFYPKYWKNEEILLKILEKWGHFSLFLLYFLPEFLFEMYMLNKFLYLLNSLNKTLKKYWKIKKYTGKIREICQSKNVGTMG